MICRFIDRAGPDTSWAGFLWSRDPAVGIFMGQEPAVQRARSNEQYRFFWATLRHDPAAQIAASTRNWLVQLWQFGVTTANYKHSQVEGYAEHFPASHFNRLRETRAYRGEWPSGTYSLITRVTFVISLFFAAFLIVRWRRTRHDGADGRPPVLALVLLLALGVLLNAAITGVLSGQVDRYQARVIWLVPFGAMLLDFAVRDPWWRRVFNEGSG